jgi:hypothetical protein
MRGSGLGAPSASGSRCHASLARSMKWVPIRLPGPREPECSMSHTFGATLGGFDADLDEVVPRAEGAELLDRGSRRAPTIVGERRDAFSRCSPSRARDGAASRCESRRAPRRSASRPTTRSRRARPPESRPRSPRGASPDGARWQLRLVRIAIIPQPMSTPTAAGMIAPRVGITEPTVAPMPQCTSGMIATCGPTIGSEATLRICAIASSSTSTPSVQSLISAIPSLHRRRPHLSRIPARSFSAAGSCSGPSPGPHLTLMRAVSTQSVSFRRRSRIRSR